MESLPNEVLSNIVDQLIDEEALGVCFELHRAIKLGYYELIHPDKSAFEKHDIVDQPGLDVFGNSIQTFRKPVECVCPSCQRTLGASKFAPHLEKCLGMGRSSTRLAHKKTTQVSVESEGDQSDDNEDDWTYPSEKKIKKFKRDKLFPPPLTSGRKTSIKPIKDGYQSNGSSHTSSNDDFYNIKPSLQQHNAASFSALPIEYKHHLLQQICGVISERTGRLCTRTIKCPQHSEEDRQDVRRMLLENTQPVEIGGPPAIHSSLDYLEETPIKDKYISTDEPLKRKKQREGSKKHKKSSHHPSF